VEARHVDLRKRHVRRTDLKRNYEVSERRKGNGHDAEKHHDGAMHCSEGVIPSGREHALHPFRRGLEDALSKNELKRTANHRHGHPRVGQLPPHDQHQQKTEEEEKQPGDAVLHTDHLVIGRKNPLLPEAGLVVVIVGMMIVVAVSVCGHT
jgi:hypothetical protein